MKRILVVVHRLSVSSGLTSFYMNYYTRMDLSDYQIDFLQTRDEETPYADIIKKNGGIIYTLPKYKNNRDKKLYEYVDRLLADGRYSVIHVNISDFLATLILYYAWKNKVPHRIFHSHNTKRLGEGLKVRILCSVYDRLCIKFATNLLACTSRAGTEIFGKTKFQVINNAIHVDKFDYSEEDRNRLRKELGIKDGCIVLGTVCRQAIQKNPFFMIDILNECVRLYGDVVLLWIGTGPLYSDVVRYAKEHGLSDNLIMVGDREDICRWYSAMDAFLMPSLFEGLGIVYIEAQASGLPTFASDCVPRDSSITELIQYISLDTDKATWAKSIYEACSNTERKGRVQEIIEADYGVSKERNALKDYYDSLD